LFLFNIDGSAWEVESAIITSDRHESRHSLINVTTGAHDSVLRGSVAFVDGDEAQEIIVYVNKLSNN
jgi:hypothetical protein